MGVFNFFHITKSFEKDIKREKECISRIRNAVAQKCGVDNFIEYDEFTVAFAGSRDNMELMLEICTQKYNGEKYLYASVDDEISWQEYDFENLDEFENSIIMYIANRVNRTIKTITEVNNKKFKETSYYLNGNDEWVCFEDFSSNDMLVSFITDKLTESSETIKTYKLDN